MDAPTTNHLKYQTGNPIVRRLMDRFFGTVSEIVARCDAGSALDAGCGEGHALGRLREVLPAEILGVDANPEAIDQARRTLPDVKLGVGSIYDLGLPDRSVDLTLCLEVLEHLDRPEDGLAELVRVTRRDLVLSVPWEPWFRLGSLARGKYLATLGNHPEHVQQWGRRTFAEFLASSERLSDVTITTAGPWIVAHGRVRGA